MNRLFILISMFSFTGSICVISGVDKEPKVSGYHLKYVVPLPNKQGGFTFADTNYDVFYYGNLMMYKVYYTFDSSLNKSPILNEERSYFLVYNKDSAYGQTFHQIPRSGKTSERISVASIINNLRFESDAYDTFSRMKMDSSYYEGDDLVRVYEIEPTATFPEKFTYSFCYSRTINPPTEYFSRVMDNVKNMRLYKIRIHAHGGQWPNESFYYPERELRLEMSHTTTSEKEEAMYYFKKYLEHNK